MMRSEGRETSQITIVHTPKHHQKTPHGNAHTTILHHHFHTNMRGKVFVG
jgi:hypothetical protein